MLAVEDGLFELVLLDQLLELPLPLDLRLSAQVLPVEPQQVEREVDQAVLIAAAEVGG